MAEALIFGSAKAHQIRAIVRKWQTAVLAGLLGWDVLSPAERRLLRAAQLELPLRGGLVRKPGGQLELPMALAQDPIENAFRFGQIETSVTESASSTRAKVQDAPPLTEAERAAVVAARESAGLHLRNVFARVEAATGRALNEADQRAAVAAQTGQALDERRTVSELKTRLGHITEEHERDWTRVAMTELQNAHQAGTAARIRASDGGHAWVAKVPRPDACPHCKRLYLGADGQPKIFKLSNLQANGTNVGKKVAEWDAVVGTLHPHCQCVLTRIPEGYGFDGSGQLVPGGELGERTEKAIVPDCDDCANVAPVADVAIPVLIEIPDWLGELFALEEAEQLGKAATHKYVRRVPTGNPKKPWRYFYAVSGGAGLAHDSEIQEGAKFRIGDEGKLGHLHVDKTHDDDTVTVTHDESGRTERISKEVLRDRLRKEHRGAINQTRAKLARTAEAAAKHGSEKQRTKAETAHASFVEQFGTGKRVSRAEARQALQERIARSPDARSLDRVDLRAPLGVDDLHKLAVFSSKKQALAAAKAIGWYGKSAHKQLDSADRARLRKVNHPAVKEAHGGWVIWEGEGKGLTDAAFDALLKMKPKERPAQERPKAIKVPKPLGERDPDRIQKTGPGGGYGKVVDELAREGGIDLGAVDWTETLKDHLRTLLPDAAWKRIGKLEAKKAPQGEIVRAALSESLRAANVETWRDLYEKKDAVGTQSVLEFLQEHDDLRSLQVPQEHMARHTSEQSAAAEDRYYREIAEAQGWDVDDPSTWNRAKELPTADEDEVPFSLTSDWAKGLQYLPLRVVEDGWGERWNELPWWLGESVWFDRGESTIVRSLDGNEFDRRVFVKSLGRPVSALAAGSLWHSRALGIEFEIARVDGSDVRIVSDHGSAWVDDGMIAGLLAGGLIQKGLMSEFVPPYPDRAIATGGGITDPWDGDTRRRADVRRKVEDVPALNWDVPERPKGPRPKKAPERLVVRMEPRKLVREEAHLHAFD